MIKFLRAPQIGFYTLMLTLIFPFQIFFTHNRAYLFGDAVMLLIFGLMIVRAILNKQRIGLDKAAKILFLFLIFNFAGVVYVSHYVADDQLVTLFYQFFILIKGLLLYVIAFNLIKEREHVKTIAVLAALIAIATSCYFIYEHVYVTSQLSGHQYRADDFYSTLDDVYSDNNSNIIKAWIGGPNGRAKFSLLLAAFILGYMNFKEGFSKNFLNWMALAFCTVSIVFQMSRSSYGFFIIIMILYIMKNTRLKHVGLPRILVVGLLGVLFFYALSSSPYAMDKLQYLSKSDASANTRLELFSDAILASSSNLFLGNGFYAIRLAPELFYKYNSFRNGAGTHNTYLEILLDSGLAGLAAFIWFLTVVFRNNKQLEKDGSDVWFRYFGSGVQFLLIAAALNFLTSHGILKNTMLFGLAWLLIGAGSGLLQQVKIHASHTDSSPNHTIRPVKVISINSVSHPIKKAGM